MAAPVALKEGKIFLKKKHELSDLLKKLDDTTDNAIDLIVQQMMDEKQTMKTRLDCAKTLIDYKVSISEAINKDELTRQIAEIKVNGLDRPLVPDNSGPKAPRLDMKTVQKV